MKLALAANCLLGATSLSAQAPSARPDPGGPLDDAAFQAALPPLDQVAAPAPPTAPPPIAIDAAPLTAQLPPLAGFDPTPVPPTPARQAQGAEPRGLRYRLEISGLRQIGLEAQFRALSTLLHDGRNAANAAQIRARADADVTLAERLLRAEGYYDGIATALIPSSVGATAAVPVAIVATPGTRYRIGGVTLMGLASEPRRIATDALALNIGDPVAAAAIQDAEAHLSLALPQRGYPFVVVGQRDILLDDATHLGAYTLPVDAGPKSSFGRLRTAGAPVFALDHLAIFPRFTAGETYDSRKVDDLRQALIGTSIFSTVAIEPVRTGTTNPDGTEAVDLLVRQAAGKARTVSASAGYGTGEGVKLVGEWQNRDAFPPEGALVFDLTAGTQQQALGATFRRSDAGQRDRTFQAGLTVSRDRFDAYKAETADLLVTLSRQSTPIWQKHWTYSIGGELLASRENPFDPGDLLHPRSTYYIAALPLQGGYDGSDSLLDPTRGFRATAKLSPEVQKRDGGGLDKYVRTLAEVSGYYPLIDNVLVLAGRARLGSIVGAARDDIAPSRRLYSGGGGSVRGFGYEQLGPKDDDNNPIGGRSLAEFAIEARYRFGNYGIVPFVDAGRVGEKSAPSLSGLRYGIGIGARYYTNFGPFRVDVATPIGRRPGESKIALYISIGQAF